MYRRQWLLLTVILIATFQLPSASAPQTRPRQQEFAGPFGFETVQRLALQRSARPYHDQSSPMPDSLAKLNFDAYQEIRYRPEDALWHDQSLFEIQFFHRGFNFQHQINVWEVTADGAHPIQYNPAQFDFGKTSQPKDLPKDLGFAGLRVHYPLHTPAYKDELLAFLGASYFRVLGRNQSYGASARGLAVNVATTNGEEFPYFTDFWLVRPQAQQRSLTIYALLDSPSVAGAYRFEVLPGTISTVQVSVTLYPRTHVDKLGLAPLTSMFLYGKEHAARPFDDFRPEVHDSDGLLAQTGAGEWMWRPLINPRMLNVASFSDENPRGFGLAQRERNFARYLDEDAHYQSRPSYWVTPLGGWGKGAVELVEIPNDEEIHDNIAAYWVPAVAPRAHRPFSFSYLLSAYAQPNVWPPGGRAVATRTNPILHKGSPENSRRFLIDFAGGDLDVLAAAQPVTADINARNADVDEVSVQRLAESGNWRLTFRVTPKSNQPADLRCYLKLYDEALSETWTYLWTP